MIPTAIFITVHKGASTFVADELGPAVAATGLYPEIVNVGRRILDGETYADFPITPHGMMVIRLYPQEVDRLVASPPSDAVLDGKKLVLLWRDPRDVAVSLYYSKAYSHSADVRDPERLMKDREALREVGVHQGVLDQTARPAIREFKLIRALADRYPDAVAMSYEQLLTDSAAWLASVSSHLGWSASATDSIAERIAGAFDIPTEEDPNRHKRRMRPGNWTEVFDDQLQRLFDRLAGAELAEAGYHW